MTIMILAAALAGPAPAPALISCRQGECIWSRPVSSMVVRSTPAGTLRKLVFIQGASLHGDNPPSRYNPSVRIRWEKAPSTDYVFCSRSKPALAFAGDRGWIAHALDPFNLGGYNRASAVIYLRACHGVDLNRRDIDKVLRSLGYRPGTRNEQVEISRPEQLFRLPPRRRD
jgi:hypothetical protein